MKYSQKKSLSDALTTKFEYLKCSELRLLDDIQATQYNGGQALGYESEIAWDEYQIGRSKPNRNDQS